MIYQYFNTEIQFHFWWTHVKQEIPGELNATSSQDSTFCLVCIDIPRRPKFPGLLCQFVYISILFWFFLARSGSLQEGNVATFFLRKFYDFVTVYFCPQKGFRQILFEKLKAHKRRSNFIIFLRKISKDSCIWDSCSLLKNVKTHFEPILLHTLLYYFIGALPWKKN